MLLPAAGRVPSLLIITHHKARAGSIAFTFCVLSSVFGTLLAFCFGLRVLSFPVHIKLRVFQALAEGDFFAPGLQFSVVAGIIWGILLVGWLPGWTGETGQ